MDSNAKKSDERETVRLEAFSDGVFAFAITLLVLYLKDPVLTGGGGLFQGLLDQWPTFFAFVTSFMTILIMWIGHHETFTYIKRIDRRFMFLNGFLLFFVTLTPFTTSLVADHILSSDSGTAAAVYSGSFLLLSVAWNLLWRHASRHNRLLDREVPPSVVQAMARNFYVGPICYTAALLIAPVSGISSVVLVFAVAVFFAVATSTPQRSLQSQLQGARPSTHRSMIA
ncbi:MAG: TMEM175 family protein [Thaumarchaeota archaeon]|nr:TMEM175 family protein [Nitrososphaerota archaeon]